MKNKKRYFVFNDFSGYVIVEGKKKTLYYNKVVTGYSGRSDISSTREEHINAMEVEFSEFVLMGFCHE